MVVPCYKVSRHIARVISSIGDEIHAIYCIDDACPEDSVLHIQSCLQDPRVELIRHASNQGVGGAVISGYRKAIADGADVIVKLDGDGQMDPALIPIFIAPIVEGYADYVKGNRFFDLQEIRQMPLSRRIGNLALSFMSKASTGYWNIFDPTNGYTAIHAKIAARLPLDRISQRYFFESDMLFRLNTIRAVVVDVPMDANYGDETSNLNVRQALPEFFVKHLRNFCKRIAYNYYLRDLSLASLELVMGSALLLFGLVFGGWHWFVSATSGTPAPLGTVMIAALSLLTGMQLGLAFLGYDIANTPKHAIHPRLRLPLKYRGDGQ